MNRALLTFAILATVLMVLAGPAAAQSPRMIWSGVVFATNVETPAPPPDELIPFLEKLKSVFGYNQFEVVGRHIELMDQPVERWLVPSKIFCLRVNSKQAGANGYVLKLQLFQRTKMLTEFEAKVTTQSPLVIRGPLCGNGQLLFVLMLQ
jgi:hypothetical protein